MNPTDRFHHRANVQKAGLENAEDEAIAFLAKHPLLESGKRPTVKELIEFTKFVVRIGYRGGVNAEADALQPEFTEMGEQIATLETHLSGFPTRWRN